MVLCAQVCLSAVADYVIDNGVESTREVLVVTIQSDCRQVADIYAASLRFSHLETFNQSRDATYTAL